MAWDDFGSWLGDLGDFGTSAMDTGSGWDPQSIMTALSGFGNLGEQTSGGLLTALSNMDPKILGMLVGAGGPLAGLMGTLAAGGNTGGSSGTSSGTNNQTSNTSGSSSGFSNTQTNRQDVTDSSQSGFSNTTNAQTLDPAAQQAMDRLNAMLGNNAGGAQGAYNKGLSMLEALATGQMGQFMNQQGGGMERAAPNTTPSPQEVEGFPDRLPTHFDSGLGNLIKQAFGSFVGDIGTQAITNARNRGFAGGGDLLNTAAAPVAGPALAQVPAMEAKAYLDHVLQAYDLQSQNAGRKAGAQAGALNAATNALAPGVTTYGIDRQADVANRQADNQQIGAMTSLLQALMGPQGQLMNANLGLLNAAPRGSTQNTLTGGQTNTTLSGMSNTNTQDQRNNNQTTNTFGNTSGSQTGNTTKPMGPQLANDIGNIIMGGAQGYTNPSNPTGTNKPNPWQQFIDFMNKK